MNPNPSASRKAGVAVPAAFRRTRAAAGLLALCAAGAALRADNTWDGGGADGNWSTLANWGGDTTPVSPTALSFGGGLQLASNNDLFTAGTVFNGITFNAGAGAFTLTGNSVSLGGNVTNNSANTQTINLALALTGTRTFTTAAGGADLAVGGVISGASGVTKAGLGTLTLNGSSANIYTGATSVNGGTLLLDFANMSTPTDLVASTSTLTTGGGVLLVKGKASGSTSQTLGNVTQTGSTYNQITVNANGGTGTTLALGTLGHNGGGTTLIDISSTGAAVTTGSANTNGLLNASYLVKDSSGTGFATKSGSTVVRFDDTAATTLSSASTTGTVNYSTRNSVYTGGTLTLASGAQSLNSLTIDTTNNGGVIDLNTGVKTLTGTGVLFRGANDLTVTNGQLGANGSEVIVHQLGSGKLTVNGTVSGTTGRLTKDGAGELVLGGANTYTGATVVNDGTLTVNNTLGATAVTVGGAVGTVGTAPVFTLGATNALSSGSITINNANAVVNANAANAIGSGVTLTLTAGTLNLNAAQTRSGSVSVNTGFTLGIGDDGALGSASLVLGGGTVRANGAARTISNAFEQGNAVSTIGGSQNLTFNGLFTNKGTSTITLTNGGLTTFGGGIVLRDSGTAQRTLGFTGTGSLAITSAITNGTSYSGTMTFSNTGVTTLSGNNTYTGVTTIGDAVNAATVKLGHANALGYGLNAASAVAGGTTVASGSTLDLNGQAGVVEAITINGNGVGGNGALVNNNASAAAVLDFGIASVSKNLAGAGYSDVTVTISGGGGTGATATGTLLADKLDAITLTNAGSGYTSAPTITVTGTGGTGATGTLVMSSLGLATASRVGGAGDIVANVPLTGAALTKVGAGSLVLNGSFANAITVSAGTLGGAGTGTGAVTVNSGAALTGGRLGSVGTFATTGITTLSSGSTLVVDFNSTTGVFDRIVTGGLLLSGATLSLNDLGSGGGLVLGSTFVLVDKTGAGSIGGTFAGLNEGDTVTVGGTTFSLSYLGGNGNDIALTVAALAAVPEPSAYGVLFGGCALAGALWNRRRRSAA